MPRFEQHGTRDQSYNHAHRHWHPSFAMQDIDNDEYCGSCFETLQLVQIAIDIDQKKRTVVEYKLARRASATVETVSAVLILYTPGDKANCDVCKYPTCECDACECPCCNIVSGNEIRNITKLRRRNLYPVRGELEDITMEDREREIAQLHANHTCP